MAQLNLYKYVNPGGIRDKNLEQITINAQKFMIRKGGNQQGSGFSDGTNAINSFGRKLILGINRLGGSVNSTIKTVDSLNTNVKSINSNLKTSSTSQSKFYKAYFDNQKKILKIRSDKDKRDQQSKRRDLDKQSESKSEGLAGKFLGPVKSVAKKIGGGILDFLSNLFGLLLKTALLTGVLKFISDPKNVEKVGKFFIVVREFIKFCFRIIEFGVGNVIDGLVKIIDGGIFTKIVGVIQFLVGAFVLFKGISWLKNPFSIIKDLRLAFKVLQYLPKALMMAAKAAKAITLAASRKFGWKGVLLGTGVAIGGAMAIDKMTEGGGEEPPAGQSQPAPGAPPAAEAPPAAPQQSPSGEKPKPTNQQFAVGGVAKGPDSGYNVTLHGTEAIVPLDNRYTRGGGDPFANIMPGLSKGVIGGVANQIGGQTGGSSNILGGEMGLSKTAQSLSSGMRMPFKAVGASLLANLGNVVSSLGPIGDLVKPFVQQIATPIAQSFGVPSNIVSVITSKEKIDKQSLEGKPSGKKDGGDLRTVIGEGSKTIKKPDEKSKWTPSGDKSIRGMLADVVSGLLYMSGKLEGGGGGGGSDPGTSPAGGAAPAGGGEAAGGSSTGAQGGGAAGGSTNTASETIKSAGGMREDGTLKGVQGQSKVIANTRGGGSIKEHSPGAGLVPVDGGNRKYWYNKSGDVFKWEKPGDPLTDITSSGDKEMLKALGGPLVRDLKNGQVKIIKGLFGGDQTPVGYFSYEMGSVLKARGKNGGRTGNTPDKWEKPTDGRYGPTITPKAEPPKKAAGGWISGPQSGYPVSLDGGSSVAFEGHGTEWVGMKRSGGGSTSSAFVIPYDTPKTKSHPGLTQKRFNEAKSGGYVLPFAKGGTVRTDPNWKGDTGPGSRWFQVSNQQSKEKWREKNKKFKFADGGKIAEAAKSMVGKQYFANACAISTRDMLAKAGVVPKPEVTSRVLDKGTPGAEPTGKAKANSFGSDQGAVIKSAGAVKEGDVVLWDTGGGVIGHVGVSIGNGQTVHNSSSAGYRLAKMGINAMKFHSAVRLGETGTADSSSSSSSSSSGSSSSSSSGGSSSANWWETLGKAFSGETARELIGAPATPSTEGTTTTPPTAIKPSTPATPTGSQVLQQSSQLRDTKAADASKPQVSAINNNQGTTGQTGGGGGVVSINTGAGGTKKNNTDFLVPQGSPFTNYVSPESLSLIK